MVKGEHLFPVIVFGGLFVIILAVVFYFSGENKDKLAIVEHEVGDILEQDVQLQDDADKKLLDYGDGNYKFLGDDKIYDVQLEEWEVKNIVSEGKVVYKNKK